MQRYAHTVSGGLLEGRRYYVGNAGKSFASPMKELNEKTVLIEKPKENKNDSYRQHTKYDDKLDQYHSSYDLNALIGNINSYLEGTLSHNGDVDYYSFSYQQKGFYSRMGISSQITISLEDIPEGCNYNLIVYDMYGNQIGTAKADGNGSKEVVLPDWDSVTDRYIIRVENENGTDVRSNESYKIKISENKSITDSNSVQHAEGMFGANNQQEKDNVKGQFEKRYLEELENLHKDQYDALPENEKYTGTETVDELLKRMASGEELSNEEIKYLKIFANLVDYEKAEASGKIHSVLYPQIMKEIEKNEIDVKGKEWGIELDVSGKLVITGEISEETKKMISDAMDDKFFDTLWDYYMQASDMSASEYNYINDYRDLNQFLEKSTNGKYTWNDIKVDEDGKISGLPAKMCELLNSQESNARYEDLRDKIYRLKDYEKRNGIGGISDFRVEYNISNSGISIINRDRYIVQNKGLSYYEKMTSVI